MSSYTASDYIQVANFAITVYLAISLWVLFFRSFAFGMFLTAGIVGHSVLLLEDKHTPIDSLVMTLMLPLTATLVFVFLYFVLFMEIFLKDCFSRVFNVPYTPEEHLAAQYIDSCWAFVSHRGLVTIISELIPITQPMQKFYNNCITR